MRRKVLTLGLLVAAGACASAALGAPNTPQTPSPTTYTSLEDAYLVHNPLYSAGQVPAVQCNLPDVPLTTRSDVQRSGDAMIVCLERAWKPVVERADLHFLPTDLYVVTVGAGTACGDFDDDSDAFYCADDSGIYVDWAQHVEESPDDRQYASAYLLYVLAHEFGHHLQQLVGIMGYSDDSLERGRRLELQASCLAAAFLGANQATLNLYGDRFDAYHDGAGTGDHDHGSGKNNKAWSKAAFAAKSPSACNTWAAPAKRVS
ncbi:neutral zinc metallopeptidase [Kribbella sp. NPDC059898]|uniref:neutral zinc metallopeptidase n=1 Tax=Kribbella sp. NPDC059898 TaxID=3346995 RepID=UPI00365A2799